MALANLSVTELEILLMEETKKLTSAIREGYPPERREQMRKQIQEIQKLLEEKNENNGSPNTYRH